MRHGVAAAVLTAGFVSACAIEPAEGPAANPSRTPETSQPPTPSDPASAAQVRRAVATISQSNTGRFLVEIPRGEGRVTREEGRYQLEPPAYDTVREEPIGATSLRTEQRTVGGSSWLRIGPVTNRPISARCWLDVADLTDQTSAQEGYVAFSTAPGQPPSALSAATYGVGVEPLGGGAVGGAVDLSLAVRLIAGVLVDQLQTGEPGTATVPATLQVRDERLLGYRVELAALSRTITGRGVEVPPSISTVPGAISVVFTEVGEPSDIRPPPPGEVADVEVGGDIEAALSACGNR